MSANNPGEHQYNREESIKEGHPCCYHCFPPPLAPTPSIFDAAHDELRQHEQVAPACNRLIDIAKPSVNLVAGEMA
jgi:hypothetical protein